MFKFINHKLLFTSILPSIGRSLRTLAEAEPKPLTENYAIRESLVGGEMVNKESIDKLLSSNIVQLQSKKGIIIDGYPRDLNQIQNFEEKVIVTALTFYEFKFEFSYTVQPKTAHNFTRLLKASIRKRPIGRFSFRFSSTFRII